MLVLSVLATPVESAGAQSCLRAADLPLGAFEVTAVFTGEFRTTTLPDGSVLREPVFRPIPRGTTYNRAIVNVSRGDASTLDQALGQLRKRGRMADGALEAGTYYDTWGADAAGCLVAGAVAFVPESERFGLPTAPPATPSLTPRPTATPTPSAAPSPTATATPTAAPSPTPAPTPTATPVPPPTPDSVDLGPVLPWFALLALAWVGGLAENRFDRRYRNA